MAITKPLPQPDQESVVSEETPAAVQTLQSPFTPLLQAHAAVSSPAVDIEAWTVQALESLSVSPAARGIGAPLSIPLDHDETARQRSTTPGRQVQMKLRGVVFDQGMPDLDELPRRPPSRRDSMKRREALLKGKEGTRQRRRWENDQLLHVPNVQPPTAADFSVQPTHPVQNVPYQLASYWDRGLRERAEERKHAYVAQRKQAAGVRAVPGTRAEAGKVPKELRATAKRTPAMKDWLRVLEEPVRDFMVARGIAKPTAEDSSDEMDSDDEEIVFVGRNGMTRDGALPREKGWKEARREVGNQEADSGLVLDTLGDDDVGAFKRWLTHSISDYYGLNSRSVMVGKPARRIVYVGIKPTSSHLAVAPPPTELPRPLWELF